MNSLDLLGVKADRWGVLRWTFEWTWDRRRTRVYVDTSSGGNVLDIRTDDNFQSGTTGDDEVDQALGDRIRRIIALHSAFRALDEVAAPGRRRAA